MVRVDTYFILTKFTSKLCPRAEHGWQRAMDKIAERASLAKGPDTRRKSFSTR